MHICTVKILVKVKYIYIYVLKYFEGGNTLTLYGTDPSQIKGRYHRTAKTLAARANTNLETKHLQHEANQEITQNKMYIQVIIRMFL